MDELNAKEEDYLLEKSREPHPQTGNTTPEQAKELLFEGVKR